MRVTRTIPIGALCCAATLAACDDGVRPTLDATVEGRVEQTTSGPAMSTSPDGRAPQQAPGTTAEAAAVVQVQADGSFTELARADIQAAGSFRVEGVPAGRHNLAVLVYTAGDVTGGALIHQSSRPGRTIVADPINYETTAETHAYSELRASGSTEATAASELALFLRVDGANAELAATSDAEAQAVASAYRAASATMTAVHAARGVTLSASQRTALVAEAAVGYAADRHAGMSLSAAHDVFTQASLTALGQTAAAAEATVLATAAASTTFDAALEAESSMRADLLLQPLRMNLLARERLATEFATSAESSVATRVAQVLASARADILAVGGILDLRAALSALNLLAIDAAADAAVELLAANATSTVRAEVRARAETALEAASLSARLDGVATAQAAVSAMTTYRATVRTAVQAMVGASGSASADVDALTSLFIAACADAYIR